MESDIVDKDYSFMLKEYEGINKKISQHYDGAEKTYRIYVLVIAAVVSFLGILYKDSKLFDLVIFSLGKYQLVFLAIMTIFGFFIFFKIIEHRLLIITYVRSLNLNKKWFAKNSNNNIGDYIFFDIGGHSPAYFLVLNHNFWEAIGLSFLNACLGSILSMNIFIKAMNTSSSYNFVISLFFAIAMTIILIIGQMFYYKKRAEFLDELNRDRLTDRGI